MGDESSENGLSCPFSQKGGGYPCLFQGGKEGKGGVLLEGPRDRHLSRPALGYG